MSQELTNMDVAQANRVTLGLPQETAEKIREIVDPLMLTDEQVTRVMQTQIDEMKRGLSRDPQLRKTTSLQMENTYVRSLLNGKENGNFLALDLGGTNFRILLSTMKDGKCESISRNYNVPTPKLYGPASEVFDHLAESIYLFLNEENMLKDNLPLGFTFSFPMVQESLKKGILVTWTKSFACPDGVGEDAVNMLEDALTRRGDVQVDVVAVLNDTTGTLLAGSYLDKQCQIGLIMGTGCNAAYVEKLENVDKWEGPITKPKQVVIDIEWGAFGDNGSLDFCKTEFDKEVDKHSNHIGSFTYEKYFAGHYIGDLARLALVKLANEGLAFKGSQITKLHQWKSFTAGHLSDIEKDTDSDTVNTERVFKEIELKVCAEDINIVRYVCSVLSIRATQFISASIAVLLNHIGIGEVTVAIDGSLYKYHPHLHNMMTAKVAQLAPKTKCKLILAEDGSGRGAAFVAAVAERMRCDAQS